MSEKRFGGANFGIQVQGDVSNALIESVVSGGEKRGNRGIIVGGGIEDSRLRSIVDGEDKGTNPFAEQLLDSELAAKISGLREDIRKKEFDPEGDNRGVYHQGDFTGGSIVNEARVSTGGQRYEQKQPRKSEQPNTPKQNRMDGVMEDMGVGVEDLYPHTERINAIIAVEKLQTEQKDPLSLEKLIYFLRSIIEWLTNKK